EDQTNIGLPFNKPAVLGSLNFLVGEVRMEMEVPLKFQYNDQVAGEINQPFTIVPEIQVSLNKENVFVVYGNPALLEVEVNFEGDLIEGELVFEGLSPQDYEVLDRNLAPGKNKIPYKIQINGLSAKGNNQIGVKYR